MTSAHISIVLPFRNEAAYLAACFDTILAQKYQKWELIAVDDHSDDESYAIARRFESDPRISVFRNEGRGIINALRTAYNHSSGELVTRMDGDDLMPPEKLQSLASLLQRHGKGHVATGRVQYFSSDPMGEGYLLYQDWLNRLCERNNHYDAIYKECVIASPCWMVWREDLDKCGAFNPDVYPEDYDLVFRFYRSGLKVVSSPDVLHLWRDYPTRTSRTDEKYSDQRFFDLKLSYFFELERKPESPLLVWGAGKKGKQLAHLLISMEESFEWMCNNPQKIGKDFAGKTMLDFKQTSEFQDPQILIAIGSQKDQEEIKQYLENMGLKHNANFFYFC